MKTELHDSILIVAKTKNELEIAAYQDFSNLQSFLIKTNSLMKLKYFY